MTYLVLTVVSRELSTTITDYIDAYNHMYVIFIQMEL